MDFLELFDACVIETNPRPDKYTKPTSLETTLSEEDIGLDSLDVTLTMVLLMEVYGVPESEDFNVPTTSLRDMYEYMQANKTKDFDSVEEAMESVT
tara:strand:- start:89 stop:376 length:288 start_codon:yes stop_codon:yes gene_type:complete